MGLGTVGVFVQVRLGSQRLPRKALLPLGETALISQVMASLGPVVAATRALLTDADSAEELTAPARSGGFDLFVGPADDVLARFALAAERYGVDTVVRATGDNPLVSAPLVTSILAEHERERADLSHYLGCPLGTGVEVIAAGALLEAHRDAADPREREHLSTYLYRHPADFRIHEPRAPAEAVLQDAHVSVDTPEDYERMRRIYSDLYQGAPIDVESVVRWLRGHPDQITPMRITY